MKITVKLPSETAGKPISTLPPGTYVSRNGSPVVIKRADGSYISFINGNVRYSPFDEGYQDLYYPCVIEEVIVKRG